ncbi:MAG TPA: PorP/SprF family type IX secretion system membrane protein [Mucilaginibacter sp.]|nr:PorP/SprF family type IX secretion system membrane protein [Mucilaginibacter sp.]
MKKLTGIIAVLLLLGGVNTLKAQVDPHFSQYYAYPLWLNPALTGVIDGDLRINVNAKDQWAGISNGYKTGAVSVDFKPTDRVGLGLNIINQAAGSAGYNYFAAYGSFGYGITVSEDGNKKIQFGFQAGFINRSFDPNKLQLDDQYNPITGYDPSMPSFENFATTNATVFDASAGIFYYDGDPESAANLFGGVSAAHLTSTKDPFATGGLNTRMPLRYTVHGGVRIKASDVFDITPHAIYISQKKNHIKAIGIYSELKFQDDKGLILGGMYRVNDAAVADVGYHLNNLMIGVSYDFNTSALNAATSGQGGFELSVSYVFKKRFKGPAPVCPRF